MYKRITVKKIEYHGFKNSKHVTCVDFTQFTKIYGKNGVGKTTVGEAIAWALLGCNLLGNTRADSTLINENMGSMYAKILFNDGEKDRILLRYKNSKTHLYLAEATDENWEMPIHMLRKVAAEITQRDIDIDPDVFMTIFSPAFFPNLDADRAKRIMTSFVPTVPAEQVYSQLSDHTQNLLKGFDLNFPLKLLSDTKAELKQVEDDLKYNEGAKGTLKQLIQEQEANLPKVVNQEELQALTKEREKIVSSECPQSITDSEKEEKQLAVKLESLKSKKANIEDVLGNPPIFETTEYESEILKLEKEIFKLEKKEASGLKDVSQVLADKTILEREHSKLEKLLKDGGDCPSCGRPINDEQIMPLINALQWKIQEANEKILDINSYNEKVIREFEHTIALEMNFFVDRIRNLKTKILEVEKKNKQIAADFDKQREKLLGDLEKEITLASEQLQTLSEKNKLARQDWNKEKELKLKDIDTKINTLKLQEKERELGLKSIEDNKHKYKELVTKDKMLEDEKVNLNIRIEAIKDFIEKKVELETEGINLYFDKVRIVLEKVVKSTGEIKECFELRYDGKDYRVLSTGERVMVGIEISNMVLCILGVDYPVFVDQAESVSEYQSFASQIIEATHIRGKQFTVQNEN
jgi:DNA repair exonuclease SbcCD ATPase subunit